MDPKPHPAVAMLKRVTVGQFKSNLEHQLNSLQNPANWRKAVGVHYRFLFCAGAGPFRSFACDKQLDFAGYKRVEGLWSYVFHCANCEGLRKMREWEAATNRNITQEKDRTLVIKPSYLTTGPETDPLALKFLEVDPHETIYKLEEYTVGGSRYTRTVPLTLEGKIRYYLRGFVPDKDLALI